MGNAPVTFCLPEPDAVEEIAALSPDRDWRAFGATRPTWIGQTYLRLREAGHAVALSRTPPDEGVVVIEATSRKSLFTQRLAPQVLLVAVRADHRPQRYADVEIVQNDRFADGERVFFVPHWPQPGLIPRAAARGAQLRTAAFKGHAPNLHRDFRSRRWLDFLRTRGIEWLDEGVPWQGQDARYEQCRWNDFSEIDLVVAVRERWHDPYLRKPASKLVNAWLAGVPAILGPEYAYGRLRRSDLDFFEVSTLEQAMDAVCRLQDEPGLYEATVKNGLLRARELSVAAVTKRWSALLFDGLVPAARARARRRGLALSRRYKRARHRLQRVRP